LILQLFLPSYFIDLKLFIIQQYFHEALSQEKILIIYGKVIIF